MKERSGISKKLIKRLTLIILLLVAVCLLPLPIPFMRDVIGNFHTEGQLSNSTPGHFEINGWKYLYLFRENKFSGTITLINNGNAFSGVSTHKGTKWTISKKHSLQADSQELKLSAMHTSKPKKASYYGGLGDMQVLLDDTYILVSSNFRDVYLIYNANKGQPLYFSCGNMAAEKAITLLKEAKSEFDEYYIPWYKENSQNGGT